MAIKSQQYDVLTKTNGHWDSGGGTLPWPEPIDLVEGKDVYDPPAPPTPAKNESWTNPHYLTTATRATSPDDISNNVQFIKNDYAKRVPVNFDGSRFFAMASDGHWCLYDAETNQFLKILQGVTDASGGAECQWYTLNPHKFLYYPAGWGLRWMSYDIRDDSRDVLFDLENVSSVAGSPGITSIKDIYPNAVRASMGAEGRPSDDLRYFAMALQNENWQVIAFVCYDLLSDAIVGLMDNTDYLSSYNWIGMCHKTRRIIIGSGVSHSESSPDGTNSYDITFNRRLKLHSYGEHADIVLMPDGTERYCCALLTGSQDPDLGKLVAIDVETGHRIYPDMTWWGQGDSVGAGTAYHISGCGSRRPGWMLLGTQVFSSEQSRNWASDKLFAIEIGGKERILNIGNNFSNNTEVSGWGRAPVASCNRWFTEVFFNSAWGGNSINQVNMYRIKLPFGTVPPHGGNLPEPPDGEVEIFSVSDPTEDEKRVAITGAHLDNVTRAEIVQDSEALEVEFIGGKSIGGFWMPEITATRLHYGQYDLVLTHPDGQVIESGLTVNSAMGNWMSPEAIHPDSTKRLDADPAPTVQDQFVAPVQVDGHSFAIKPDLSMRLDGSAPAGDYSYDVSMYDASQKSWSEAPQTLRAGGSGATGGGGCNNIQSVIREKRRD